jgi:diphthamide synthase (EF-2-diphthine--ammonia ligase)
MVDSNFLGKDFAGRTFDAQFLSDLPSNVDPCGENGEFHTFVYDEPIFHERIFFTKGEIVLRENRFYYCDLIPSNE